MKFSVRGRDLQSTVLDAQRQVGKQVAMPPGSHLEWSGQINELEEAGRKNEDRVKALFARVKAEEALREKVKASLGHATALLDQESPGADEELSDEDLAEA